MTGIMRHAATDWTDVSIERRTVRRDETEWEVVDIKGLITDKEADDG